MRIKIASSTEVKVTHDCEPRRSSQDSSQNSSEEDHHRGFDIGFAIEAKFY
jgi:hypothetical protein